MFERKNKKKIKNNNIFYIILDYIKFCSKVRIRLFTYISGLLLFILGSVIIYYSYIYWLNYSSCKSLPIVFSSYQAIITGRADDDFVNSSFDNLRNFSTKYRKTKYGKQASLLLGILLSQKLNYHDSYIIFKELSNNIEISNFLLPLIFLGLAQVSENTNKYNEAADYYSVIVNMVNREEECYNYLLSQARVLEINNNISTALELYSYIVKNEKKRRVLYCIYLRLGLIGIIST